MRSRVGCRGVLSLAVVLAGSGLGGLAYGAAQPNYIATPLITGSPNNISTPGVPPYTPTEISHAYGFDKVKFNLGTVTGDGTGQTIAIVDAYDNPNIVSDLAIFNSTFGLPAVPSFSKVNQTGGSVMPTGDQGWGMEIALDVQWAHALAPKAKILLVEANTNNDSDLLTAVDYARAQPGVSVVSMSWGGSEWSGAHTLDSHFTTPSGHNGVTFLASSGDSGAGVSWPAASKNVVAVGGTTLNLKTTGDYGYLSESAWSGSGGGTSTDEPKPAYQNLISTPSGGRSVPDVSLNADPNTGVYVYDTYEPTPGWYRVGGTSFSAPAWGALIALTNQGRALAGLGTLDGGTETLPALYRLPAADFNDITTGSNGLPAGPGYDLVTGRGTPLVDQVVAGLVPEPASIGLLSLGTLALLRRRRH
ncbi:MAG: S53 family peptidase [Phycisphaerae bacterium]